jgi:hypothetical protein
MDMPLDLLKKRRTLQSKKNGALLRLILFATSLFSGFDLSSVFAQEDHLEIEISSQSPSPSALTWLTQNSSASKTNPSPQYFIPLKGRLSTPHLSMILTQVNQTLTFDRITPENLFFTTPELLVTQKNTPFEITLIDFEGNIFKENFSLNILNWESLIPHSPPTPQDGESPTPAVQNSEDPLPNWSAGLGYSLIHYEQTAPSVKPFQTHSPALTLSLLRQHPLIRHQLYVFLRTQISSVQLSEGFITKGMQIFDLELGADYFLKKPSLQSHSLKLRANLLYSTTFSSENIGYTQLPGLSLGLGFERPIQSSYRLLLGGSFSLLYNGSKIETPPRGRIQLFTGIAFYPSASKNRVLFKLEYTHQNVNLLYSLNSSSSQLNSTLNQFLAGLQYDF